MFLVLIHSHRAQTPRFPMCQANPEEFEDAKIFYFLSFLTGLAGGLRTTPLLSSVPDFLSLSRYHL